MRLEIQERGSREFYDEIVYVSAKRRDIEKGKKIRLNTFSRYYRSYILLGIFGTGLMLIFYLLLQMNIFLMFAGMMLFSTIFILLNYFNIGKYIDNMMNEEDTKVIELDDECLKYSDAKKSVVYKWDDLLGILKGKHSLVFIPKQVNDLAIAVEDRYCDGIDEFLKEKGLEHLLVRTV